MIFWSSSEASPEATELFRQIRKSAEPLVNEHLHSATMESKWDEWKWAFIAIIISPALGVEYPERVRSSKSNKVLEFRLKIDFGEFLSVSQADRIGLVFKQLHRCVDLMGKYGVNEKDRETLHEILHNVAGDKVLASER